MDGKYEVLKQYFGYTEFRTGQEELIDAMVAGRDALGIMPTGSGKSLCYQVPALMMDGITLVISPLISLMKDQVAALGNAGVAAAFINSSLTPEQIRTAYKRLRMGRYKIVYVAPERLQTYDFLEAIRDLRISMLAVDEAHCISQWGQDFRPSYLKIVDFLEELPYRPVVSAFTATATEKVARDIESILQLEDPVKLVTGFDRPNLRFEVRRPANKLTELLGLLQERTGKSGIIYCATRKDTETVCETLVEHGYRATRYHAGLSEEERRRNQDDFLYDRATIMVATNAFGMGIDKSNVAFVIHYNMPKCIEAYYQEAGRAGRDGTAAECILLYASKDVQTAKFLIQTPAEQSDLDPMQQEQIMHQDFERLDRMIGYCHTRRCLRGYILEYFGQSHGETCGNCGNCTGSFVEQDMTGQACSILECVAQVRDHLGYYLGENLIIKILRGSRTKKILETGLNSLPTYGSLASLSEEAVAAELAVLREEKLLRSNHEYGVLERTDRTLGPEETVSIRIPLKREQAAPAGRPVPVHAAEVEQLKALRARLARQENVPVYIIFSNATLQEMAERKPRSLEEFLQVPGVGAYKAQRYGAAFLAKIAELGETQ